MNKVYKWLLAVGVALGAAACDEQSVPNIDDLMSPEDSVVVSGEGLQIHDIKFSDDYKVMTVSARLLHDVGTYDLTDSSMVNVDVQQEVKLISGQIIQETQPVVTGVTNVSREQVAKLKAQRAEEQAKLDQINDAISSANAKISGIDVKIAECSQSIAKTTLNEVANALRFAANEKTSSPPSVDDGAESNAERVKQEKKAEETDIGNVIRESLDKIDAQIRKVLDESQMKVEA